MLKGIKKGAQATQQKNNTLPQQSSQSRREQQIYRDFQPTLYKNKQKRLKDQFIMEQEDDQLNIEESAQSIQKQVQQDLKKKAIQILQYFKIGNQKAICQQFKQFQLLQKRLFNEKNLLNQFPSQLNPDKIQDQKQQHNHKQDSKKQKTSRFQYNFNYEESDQQNPKNNKKSKKRQYKNRPIIKSQKIQNYCLYCPDNEELKLISASNYVYLAFPKKKTFNKLWHFILAPVEHQQSTIGLNQDVLTEINNYKKCLLQMFDKKNYLVVFWEQYFQQNSHVFIECLAVPFVKGQDFPFFFKQALQSIQGNWTTHKSIIKIEKQKGGLQKQIPKKINYFYIDFSLGYGYAHVIQNQKFWKRDFCNQVIATAVGLQLYEVKTASQFSEEELTEKQIQFKKMWQPFDWTKFI